MKRRRILLVEDNEHIREAFSLLLEDGGYEVHAAGSGAEAIRSAADGRPELILLDLGLPDMAGLEVAREIQRQVGDSPIPIIALTGRALESDREAALAAGCVGHLTKPIKTATLLASLRQYLSP